MAASKTTNARLLILLLGMLPLTGGARQIPIILLHTTDLHATVLPTTDYEGAPNVGGMARCASAIRQIRSQEKNVLLVDAGDLYQGSALGYRTGGSVMIRALNALRYDAWTLGNHEFDWGIDRVAERLNEARVPILAANLHFQPTSNTPPHVIEGFQKIRPFVIREMDGVKIGIVGLNTPGIPHWSRPRLIPGIALEDSVSALRRVIPQMKADGCEILVLVAHQGIRDSGDDHANQILAISRAIPELDVIIGGHTHQAHPHRTLHGILYTQANYWGTSLGRVDLLYDTDQRKLIAREGKLIPMDASAPLDPDLLNLLRSEMDETERFLKTKVGEAAERIHSLTAPKRETPLFNLLCASISEAVQERGGRVDAVLHGILNDRAVLNPGPVMMRDIFEAVPYENTIGVAELTRDQWLEILEENAAAYSSGRFRGIWGMMMKLRPGRTEGNRVVFLGTRDGVSAPPHRRYHVAFNSYDLASGGNRWKRLREIVDQPQAQLVEYDFQTRDAVVKYIRKHSPLKAEHHGWWSLDRPHTSRDRQPP